MAGLPTRRAWVLVGPPLSANGPKLGAALLRSPGAMKPQVAPLSRLCPSGLGDQTFGQRGLLAVGDHPADHVAAVDVEDDVQVEVRPLGGAEQLGDVPAPDLIGSGRQQLRLRVGRMDERVAAWARLPLGRQEAVHGALGGEVGALIQEGGVHGGRGSILETLRVERLQHRRLFGGAQGTRMDARHLHAWRARRWRWHGFTLLQRRGWGQELAALAYRALVPRAW